MDNRNLSELKEKLEKDRASIEKELKNFAEKDHNLPGDWDTRFPKLNGGNLEEAADEVEEYSNLLSQEYSLELRLRDIDSALEKIKNGTYGICERCKKEISIERLMVSPEAKTCNKCKK
jgi:DnaK suppressor protein